MAVASLCLFVSLLPVEASAQDGAVDPEELIREQTTDTGSGRLLDNFDLGTAERRSELKRDLGLSFAGTFYTSIQTGLDDDADVANGLAVLAVRWDNSDIIDGEMTSVIGYVENRHNLGGDGGAEFNAGVGAISAPNAFATEFTRFRQLYVRQTLANDAVVLAFGKFSPRASFGRSRITTDKFRQFQSATLSRASTTPLVGPHWRVHVDG